jgi:SnoaL-like domain
MLNYDDYIRVFNTGDDALLLERFFDENVTFSGGSRTYQGKAALKGFLDWAHDGVREVMRPQNVLQRDDLLFAEIDMDFHASKERPEFPFGHLRPGDLVTVKFFVTYTARDGKVVELKSMTWPPGRGVAQLPRLGAHPSQVAAFHAYCSAFSNAEFERFPTYYTEDVRLELGSVPPILGRQGIIDFYRPMFQRIREQLTVNSVVATDDTIELDALTRFTATQDAPDFVVGPLKVGEYIEGRVLVSYQLRDGLITKISVRRGGEMRHVARA